MIVFIIYVSLVFSIRDSTMRFNRLHNFENTFATKGCLIKTNIKFMQLHDSFHFDLNLLLLYDFLLHAVRHKLSFLFHLWHFFLFCKTVTQKQINRKTNKIEKKCHGTIRLDSQQFQHAVKEKQQSFFVQKCLGIVIQLDSSHIEQFKPKLVRSHSEKTSVSCGVIDYFIVCFQLFKMSTGLISYILGTAFAS